MTYNFSAGFLAAVNRLGTRYNNGAYDPTTNPGGFDNEGHVVNFVALGSDTAATGQGLADFVGYLNNTVSPLAQQAVDAAVLTAADRVQTGQDRTTTGQDKIATAADRVQTGLDRTATGQDKTATAADRVQTGLDRTQTGADRVQTGQDKTATAADRVQTGLDRAAAAASANSLQGSSVTSNTIGTGTKTFQTQAGKFFGAGSTVTAVSDSNPSGQSMTGVVTGYTGTTLTVNVNRIAGQGTYSDWTIRVSGPAGANGATGWTPVPARISRGDDVVEQIVDWTGGTGTKPLTGLYVGPLGLTGNIAEATNVRGTAGSGGGNVNPTGSISSGHVAIFSDETGNTIADGGLLAPVATSGDYADLSNTPDIPSTPGDINAAEEVHTHLAADISNASANGRSLLTAADFAAMRTLLGYAAVASSGSYADLSNKPTIPNSPGQVGAAPTVHNHVAAEISDASANGRSLLTAADYAAMRTLQGLAIGTNVQAYDADLAAIAALSTQPFGRSLLTATDANVFRIGLGLIIGTNVQAWDADLDAIAALATTTFGRSVLTAADAAALRTLAGVVNLPAATVAEVRAGTEAGKYVSPAVLMQAQEFVTFDPTAINLALFINGKVTLAAAATFATPTNAKAGASGTLRITPSGFAASWSTFWNFGPLGPPVMTAGVNRVYYQIDDGATSADCDFKAGA